MLIIYKNEAINVSTALGESQALFGKKNHELLKTFISRGMFDHHTELNDRF